MAKKHSDMSYMERVYAALSSNLNGFNKSPEQFSKAMKNPEYAKKAHLALSKTLDGFNKPLDRFQAEIAIPFVPRDNTKVVNPVLPVNNSPQAIMASKQMIANDEIERQKQKYFNPEYRPNITSGSKEVDFLYHNQYLMDLPVVGDIIRKKAYDIAKNSGGNPNLSPDQLKLIETNKVDDGYYNGNDTYEIREREAIKGPSLLDQYFSKEPLLPASKYKPKSDYMQFLPSYSIKNDDKYYGENFQKTLDLTLKERFKEKSEEAYNNFLKDKKPVYIDNDKGNMLFAQMLGRNLGGHKTGIGWDEERNLPYVSVSDAWDFEPTAYSKKWDRSWEGDATDRAYIQASLLHKAGNPFKVYDRFYFDPKTKKYIPDDKVETIGKKK